MPHLQLWRPADALETAVAWSAVLERTDGPGCLVLTRQGLPQLASAVAPEQIARGGYVLLECAGTPELIVIATGSEVSIALEAVRSAQGRGARVRLVSMPCTSVFDAQDAAWREAVLPAAVGRVVARQMRIGLRIAQVIEGHDLDFLLAAALIQGTQHIASDAAIAVDANPHCHVCPLKIWARGRMRPSVLMVSNLIWR